MSGIPKAIVLATLLCVIVGCEKGVSEQPTVRPTGPIGLPSSRPFSIDDNFEGLLIAFRDVFEKDFDVLGAQMALHRGNVKWPYCLVSIRPRRAGIFVIGHECIHVPLQKAVTREYDLCIGSTGGSRYCRFDHSWPLANVGDTVVLAIPMSPSLSQHRFFRGKPDPLFEKRALAMLSRIEDDGLGGDDQSIGVEKQVQDNLQLVRTRVSTSMCRTVNDYGHTFAAVFEAMRAGEFNIRLGPVEGWDGGRENSMNRRHSVPVLIVPAGQPLTVLASRRPNRGWPHSGALIVREGDQLETHWAYYSGPEWTHPGLVLTSAPFQPIVGGDFDEEVLSCNRPGP
jgi:hypothetical protein